MLSVGHLCFLLLNTSLRSESDGFGVQVETQRHRDCFSKRETSEAPCCWCPYEALLTESQFVVMASFAGC